MRDNKHPQPFYIDYKELDDAVQRTTNAHNRQLSQWLSARFNRPGEYLLHLDNINSQLGTLTGDNVLTFTLPIWKLRATAMTLSSLSKYFPVGVTGMGGDTWDYSGARIDTLVSGKMHSVEYFQGAKINLLTGQCINAPTYLVATAVPNRLHEFDQAYTKWVQGIRHRDRIGVLSNLDVDPHSEPCWDTKKHLDRIVNAIRDNEYPLDLLSELMGSYDWTVDGEYECIMTLLSHLLVPIKRMYGVYGDAVRDEYADYLSDAA